MYPVLNTLSVLNVLVQTETLMMTVIVYPISTKRMANVFLGNLVLQLVLNVTIMVTVHNVLTPD